MMLASTSVRVPGPLLPRLSAVLLLFLGFMASITRTSFAFSILLPLSRQQPASFRSRSMRTITPIAMLPTLSSSAADSVEFPSSSSSSSRGSQQRLFASFFRDNDDDDEEEEEDSAERKRKRDRLKNWVYGTSSGKMVEPIRLDGGSASSKEEEIDPPSTPRVQPKFDSLFAGMPSISDILGGGSKETKQMDKEEKPKDDNTSSNDDDAWFHDERIQIMKNYQEILKDMMRNLSDEVQQAPDKVPENAGAVIKSVLMQEMEREISERRDERFTERVQEYEKARHDEVENLNVEDIEVNEEVQRLMDDGEKEYERQEANRLEIEGFLKYEQQANLRREASIRKPRSDENLDQWALDRLRDMAGSRRDSDGDEMILDILSDNVQDLESRMQKESGKRTSQQPETMKEWQMYRAIASRMGGMNMTDEIDAQIQARLDSWKDYIQKEEGIRKSSGLARGPRLPFAWQEAELFERDRSASGGAVVTKEKRIEARKDLNRRSIAALESLLLTTDISRRERLQKEIEYLRTTLEASDYLDVDEKFMEDPVSEGPVDTTGLFQSYSDDEDESTSKGQGRSWGIDYEAVKRGAASAANSSGVTNDNVYGANPPAKKFFFQDDDLPSKAMPPPPSTPFFASNDESSDIDFGETFTGDSILGTMEEQKLEAFFRRSGARTVEDRERIRAEWREFQAFEKSRREKSGLSGDGDTISSDNIAYNVSAVIKDGGDFDAEAILKSIGPRPSRTKKESSISSVDKDEVMDSVYRSVAAIGGGRYRDNPEMAKKQQSSFEEFIEKENRLRNSLDDPSAVLPPRDDDLPSPEDDVEYAEEVLASMGPRPKANVARIKDAGNNMDRGDVLADDDESDFESDDEDDDEEDEVEATVIGEGDDVGLMPEWLRKENEEASGSKRKSFLGNDIDEVFDDTDYDHNMRQLAEYERRRAGRSTQIGIDISDVLGRRAFDSDDYADYKYDDDYFRDRRDLWGNKSFTARKKDLMEYIELDGLELNSLMDHKDSVYSTGVSQYLPRINKPFREFGAIFRLEGILINVNGLQMRAWTKVAEDFGFKIPSTEAIKQAAVSRPEVAVKEIFFWTEDFLECKKVAASHRQALRDVFNEWAIGQGLTISMGSDSVSPKASLAMGEEPLIAIPRPANTRPVIELEKLEAVTKAWEITAKTFGRDVPTQDQMVLATTLSPDIAVTKAFQWTADPLEIDDIVRTYRKKLQSGPTSETSAPSLVSQPQESKEENDSSSSTTSATRPQTETDMMELHYKAWSAVADAYGYNVPDSDEVLTAFVINEPEVAARGFGWTENPNALANIAKAFRYRLEELKGGCSGASSAPEPDVQASSILPETKKSGPSSDELFAVAKDAWSATAYKRGFLQPDTDQIRFAMSVGPEEAVVTGFGWASNPSQATPIVEAYRDEIRRRRPGWLKDDSSNKPPPITERLVKPTPSGPSADDLFRAVKDSWTTVAERSSLHVPDDEQIQFAISVGPEEAILTGFCWTEERSKVEELVKLYREEIGKRRTAWQDSLTLSAGTGVAKEDNALPMFQVIPGAEKWVKSLMDVEMQCSLVSYLEGYQVETLLKHAGLDHLIPPENRVSASHGYVTDKDAILGAALRLERRPDLCVVFDTTPQASVAAHDVEMQSVSLIGPYPQYELLSADTTAASFDDLTAMNLRRLFGVRIYDQPLADAQRSEPEARKRIKTRYFFDDD
jgi:beta-phosphoglucomutase-like phosphatase (HAD superfamily)